MEENPNFIKRLNNINKFSWFKKRQTQSTRKTRKMASSSELNIARKNLADALGDSMSLYLQNLNCWFRRKLTKEEFDYQARKLMRSDTVHLHNEFLLALMAKCSLTSSSSSLKDGGSIKMSKPGKVKRRPPGGRANLQQRFVPAQILDYVPQITGKALEEGACPTPLGFVSREGLMPDLAMVHGRMLVCAWETGLADVQDTAVKLLMLALEVQLKNILTQVVKQRKGYHLREGKFVYAAGIGVKNPYATALREVSTPAGDNAPTVVTAGYAHAPSLRPSRQVGEDLAVEQEALGADFAADHQEPISLYDLADTLQLFKNSIPSHSVYAPAMERILHSKWHPSVEELAQEDIYQQETRLKHKLAERQLHGSEEIM
ncbi:hypothetical protein RRG08_014721 [Elysia crispata]|uniref:Transcriptional adapter 1-like protein n=1 Tax=Elysia crispata TaxID=231223 RepID=A0AAE1E564_9GAST|nr:hypothetical protein RRG08_014721 [Elysia crispata]